MYQDFMTTTSLSMKASKNLIHTVYIHAVGANINYIALVWKQKKSLKWHQSAIFVGFGVKNC